MPAPSSRIAVYLTVRLGCLAAFVLAGLVLPRGIPAALVIVVAGVVAVMTCFGINAGGPGERAGARPQDRWFDSHLAPQGDWPPYDHAELTPHELTPEATRLRPDAS